MAVSKTDKQKHLSAANELLNKDEAKKILIKVNMEGFFLSLAKGVITDNARDEIINHKLRGSPAIAKGAFVQALKDSMHHDKINLICKALEESDQGHAAESIRDLQQD